MSSVLTRFGVGPDDLIASCGESIVYALGNDRILRVLRVHHGGHAEAIDYHVGKASLCDEVRNDVPFDLPRLLDHGTAGEDAYTVEERIAGRSLDVALQEATGSPREALLRAYADAAFALGEVRVDRDWFGEFLYTPTIRRDAWGPYLLARAAAQVGRAGRRLRAEVVDLQQVIDDFRERAAAIDAAPALVHGDFYPGNVMVEDGTVTGVLDLGFSTVRGDRRLDLAGAAAFLEVDRPWCEPGDAAFVRRYLHGREPSMAEVDDVYRTYIAMYFSFTHEFQIPLYDWCVATLREQRT